MLRSPQQNETDQLVRIAESTGIFKANEADELLGSTLSEFHLGKLGESHFIEVLEDPKTKQLAGWAYYSPSFKAEGVWDLWWIGVDASFQRSGFGQIILNHVESSIKSRDARVLIIETSSTAPLSKARAFYLKNGYKNCGAIPDFYGPNDGKIIFSKSFSSLK